MSQFTHYLTYLYLSLSSWHFHSDGFLTNLIPSCPRQKGVRGEQEVERRLHIVHLSTRWKGGRLFVILFFLLSFCLLSCQSYGKQVVCDDLECRDGNSNDYGTFRFPVERRKPQGTQNVFFRSLPKLPLSLSFFVTFSPLWFPVEREKKDCEANKQWKEGCRSCTCQPDGKEVVCHDLECGDGKVVV